MRATPGEQLEAPGGVRTLDDLQRPGAKRSQRDLPKVNYTSGTFSHIITAVVHHFCRVPKAGITAVAILGITGIIELAGNGSDCYI